LVRTPQAKVKGMERQLLEGTWTQVREQVEAQLIPMPNGTETYVLCRSTARREKERAIRRRFSTRLKRALKNLAQRVEKGQRKDRPKTERLLGRIQARYPRVANLYEMSLSETAGHLALYWKEIEDRLMGHSSITVSQRYVHPVPEAKERAIERLEAVNARARAELPGIPQDRHLLPTVLTTGKSAQVDAEKEAF